jgi:hypothetical protein
MSAAGEHGAWCQDMCPCVAFENRSVAPPQGFWDNRYRRQQRRALEGAGGDELGGGGARAVEEGGEEEAEADWSREAHFEASKRRELL